MRALLWVSTRESTQRQRLVVGASNFLTAIEPLQIYMARWVAVALCNAIYFCGCAVNVVVYSWIRMNDRCGMPEQEPLLETSLFCAEPPPPCLDSPKSEWLDNQNWIYEMGKYTIGNGVVFDS